VASSGVENARIVWNIDGILPENLERHDLKNRFSGGLEDNRRTGSARSFTDLGNGILISDQVRFEQRHRRLRCLAPSFFVADIWSARQHEPGRTGTRRCEVEINGGYGLRARKWRVSQGRRNGLITRRSQVQILPQLRRKPLAFLHVPRVSRVRVVVRCP